MNNRRIFEGMNDKFDILLALRGAYGYSQARRHLRRLRAMRIIDVIDYVEAS